MIATNILTLINEWSNNVYAEVPNIPINLEKTVVKITIVVN